MITGEGGYAAVLAVKVGADINEGIRGTQRMSREFDTMSRRVRDSSRTMTQGATSAFGSITKGVGALIGIGGLGAMGAMALKTGLQTASSMQMAEISFKHLMGSSKAAHRELEELTRFAAETPFELPSVEQSAQLLLNAGVKAKDLKFDLTALGEAASVTTNPMDAFNRASVAVSQSLAAGKINAQDMNQLVSAGIPVWKLLGEALGLPISKVRQLSEQGKLMSADVLPKLYTQMHKDYGGAMVEQSKTLAGVWSTVKDNINIALGQALTPVANFLAGALPRALDISTGAARNLRDWWRHNKDSASTYATVLKTELFPAMGAIPGVSDKDVRALTSVKGIMDRLKWATELTIEDFLHFKLGLIDAGKVMVYAGRVIADWLIRPLGYVIFGLSLGLEPTLKKTGRELIHFADDTVAKAGDKLIELNKSAGDARAAIDALHGKTIPIKAQTDVQITKSVRDYLAASNVPGFHQKGFRVPGYGGGDKHLAFLEGGEGVVPKEAAKRPEFQTWAAFMGIPGYQFGGPVQSRFYRPTVAETRRIGISEGMVAQAALSMFMGAGGIGGAPKGVIQQYAMMLLRQYGWGGQWGAFNALEMAEAGWNPLARNPISGAFGLPQALPPTKMPLAAQRGDYRSQLQWMMAYIADVYHTPAAAWAFHQAHNWYGNGLDAIFRTPSIIGVGESGPERVRVSPAGSGDGIVISLGGISLSVNGNLSAAQRGEVLELATQVGNNVAQAILSGLNKRGSGR